MIHTVAVEPFASIDARGKKTYRSGAVYKCHIVNVNKKVLNFKGEEVISAQTIYIDTASGVSGVDDRITLPSGFDPQQPKIISVMRRSDQFGVHHTVINA